MLDLLLQLVLTSAVGASLGLFVWSLFSYPVPVEPPEHRRIAMAVGLGERETVFEQPLLAPAVSMAMGITRRLALPEVRVRVRRDLDASGNPNGYSLDEFISICIMSGGALAFVAAIVTALNIKPNAPLIMLVLGGMGLMGFYVPLVYLRGEAEQRLTRISKQLPYTLDLVGLLIGSGSTFTEAVESIVKDNPQDDLNQELQIVLAEIEFGTPRATALSNLARRIPLESVRSVVGAINQSEQLGTPLSKILKAQAGMIRTHRSVRAEKLSAEASLRLLIPGTLILLAVVLLIFGPIVLRAMSDGWYM